MKFIKGLNKDTAPVDQPEGSYRYAKNVLSNETAGAISNEPGTKYLEVLDDANEYVLGTIETTDDKVVIFTVDNSGDSKIYLYDSLGTATNTLILNTIANSVVSGNDVDLKFNIQYPIEGTYKIDPNGNLIVYFTDNLNPARSLNVTRQLNGGVPVNTLWIYGVNPATSPNKNYIDRLNLFPHSGPAPEIFFDRIANGGALKSGTYFLFLAYVDQNFVQTNFISYSLAVPIVEDDESVKPIERYDGCEPDTQTGKSIVWEIDNLNTDYEFIRPVVVHRSADKDGAPAEFAFKLNDIDISSSSATVVFSGLEGYSSAAVEDVIVDTVSYETVKTLCQLDDILYLGNLTGSRDVGYQKYANFIKLETIVHTLNPFDGYEISQDNLDYGYLDTVPLPNLIKEQGFRDMNRLSSTRAFPMPGQVHNRRGYMRDEVYAFYIAFILNDGTMSYAYHIPGRQHLTNVSINHIGNMGTTEFNEQDDVDDIVSELMPVADPALLTLSQGQGQNFHFFDFSTDLLANNTNFWHNINEFYPNTDDYQTIDANNPNVVAEDLRGQNVRHHHMPTNHNSDRTTIVSNSGFFNEAVAQTTETYYFAVGNASDNGNGLTNLEDLGLDTQGLGMNYSEATQTISTNMTNAYDNFISDVIGMYGPTGNWIYNTSPAVGTQGYFIWGKGPSGSGANSGGAIGIVNPDGHMGHDPTDGININQEPSGLSGANQLNSNLDNVTYAIFVWQETFPAVQQNGFVAHEVQSLGVVLDDIKIPQSIADKVQGFRIYYAERKHTNRRILGQDILKNTNDQATGWDIGGCAGGSAVTGATEDFLLSPGSIYDGTVNTATFHDFYLLNNRHSLVPATHTNLQYFVDMRSFLGPGDQHSDIETNDPDERCLYQESFSAMHIGEGYQMIPNASQQFMNYPLREKCKTYINGDSIYDGRGIGFGKRIYNVGGESSIVLAYTPNRTPIYGPSSIPAVNWLPAGGGASWHQLPGNGFGFSFNNSDPAPVRLELHNLQAFKTDMYLSYDTQELVWTGYEILGDELDRFIVDNNNVSLNNTNMAHRTGHIYGGDTFICRHGYRITHRPEVAGTDPHDHKSLLYVICESTDNINFRHETNKDSTYFPGSPARKILSLEANIDLTKKDNMKYADHYSLGVSDVKPAIPYPLRETDPHVFKTRIQRSAKADNTSLIDNYRVFLALQFKDLPRNRGDLWKLVSLSNLLYMHTEDSLFRTKGKQSLKLADGTESFVGSGDIFAQEPDEVIQTKYGYGGTQSQWVSMVTKHGYFTLDYRNRRVFLFKDTLYDIGKTGLESWFQDNIPFALEDYGLPTGFDNPIVGIGFHAEYDEKYDRILLTKRDLKPTNGFISMFIAGNVEFNHVSKKFEMVGGPGVLQFDDTNMFTPTGWTVSYDVELNVWVSFHDYIPYKYSRHGDELISINEGQANIWIHSDEFNRGRFYNQNYSSEFEFIYNGSKDLDKIFYSFEYMVDVYSDSATPALTHDHGFNSFYIYTTHQISDEQPIEYMINTRRVGNEWKINKFRDLAQLTNSNASIYTGPFGGSNFGVPGANVAGTITTSVEVSNSIPMFNIDGMTETINNAFINPAKSWDKQRKFRDKWVGIRLKYDNVTKKLINLYTTDVAAKKFYR